MDGMDGMSWDGMGWMGWDEDGITEYIPFLLCSDAVDVKNGAIMKFCFS